LKALQSFESFDKYFISRVSRLSRFQNFPFSVIKPFSQAKTFSCLAETRKFNLQFVMENLTINHCEGFVHYAENFLRLRVWNLAINNFFWVAREEFPRRELSQKIDSTLCGE
jgi:hypothetical protein